MNAIQVFKNTQFGEVRVSTNGNNEPLFVANDIAKILGYAYPANAIQDHVDDEDKQVVQLSDIQDVDKTPNLRGSKITVVNESGVYSLILRSNLPQAKQFKRWVTSEVLPSIRKHGIYATAPTVEAMLSDPDTTIRILQSLKEERAQRKLAENKSQLLEEVTKEQAPKVAFANAIISSKSSCLIGELAKILTQNGIKIGQNRLFDWLRENSYLGKYGERRNIPNQQYIEQGLFELKKGVRNESDGTLRTTITTKVTGKGQEYFINKFIKITV